MLFLIYNVISTENGEIPLCNVTKKTFNDKHFYYIQDNIQDNIQDD